MLLRKPAIKIAVIFILFFAIVVVLSTMFGYQTLGGYIAPLVLLSITAWLYQREGKSLAVLGLTPLKGNLMLLPIGLLLGIIFYTGGMYLVLLQKGLSIGYNQAADFSLVAAGILFFIQGVLNEELIFRGYCFQQTATRYGVVAANVVFAFLFLVWHWFSWDAWGNIGLMVSAITVCFGHFLFATAYLKSGTLFLPIGIHLGNNWAVKHFAVYQDSNQPVTREALFIVTGTVENTDSGEALTVLITIGWMLLFTALVWKFAPKLRIS
jgi:membrane protease YdiL (CAAX protease family)